MIPKSLSVIPSPLSVRENRAATLSPKKSKKTSNPAAVSSNYIFNGPYAEFFDDANNNGIFDQSRRGA
ncbi:MAG: hypothetical protein AAGF25_07920, partial [Pseudomonadota bacterium]